MTATSPPAVTDGLTQFAQRPVSVMATVHPDGRPQLSLVRPWVHNGVVDLTLTDRRVKTRNLRRDPRVALLAASVDQTSFVVVEGQAELSPVSTSPGDDTGRQLVELYRAVTGEHPDWDDYLDAMVRDARLIARVAVTREYRGGSHA